MMADNNMEKRVGDLETKVGTIEAKMDAFIQSNEAFKQEMRDFKDEMRDFKTEIRQQNQMRANEIMEIRAAMAKQQERHDQSMSAFRQEMKELRQDMKDTGKEVRNLFIAFVGIIIAIMIGVFWNNSSDKDTAKTHQKVDQAVETAER